MGHELTERLRVIEQWPGVTAAAVIGADGEVLARAGSVGQPFQLASVTKALVAIACWVAHEEGSLRFDDELTVDADPDPIVCTTADLLAHCAGLAPEGRQRLAPVGTKRIYANAGFEVLGEVVAERTSMPVAQYLHEAVVEPLGLSGTRLTGSPAHGGISTVDDLARVAAELLRPTLIDTTTHDLATSVHRPGLSGVLPGFGRHEDNCWGLGVERRCTKQPHWTSPLNSPATFGHFGASGTLLWVDPDAALALVVLTDIGFGPWAVEAWPALSTEVLTTVNGS